MRNPFLLCILLICVKASIAQVNTKRDSVVIGHTKYILQYENSNYLSKKNFNRTLNRLLGQVAVGASSGTDLANYATIEPLTGSFSLNGYGQLTKKEEAPIIALMSLNIKGGLLSNNVSELFSNSKLNTNVSGMLKFHIGPGRKMLSFFSNDNNTLKSKRDTLLKNNILQLVKVKHKMDDQNNAIYHAGLRKTITDNSLQEKRTSLKKVLDTLLVINRDSIDALSKYTDSSLKLRNTIQQLVLDSFALDQDLKMLHSDKSIMNETVGNSGESRYSQQEYLKIRQVFEDQLDTLELKAPLASAGIFWGSVAIGFSRQTYYTYTAAKPYLEQVERQTLDALGLGLSVNYYWQHFDRGRGLYLNGGFSRLKNNNTALLPTTEIIDEGKTVEADTIRKVVRKYSAYTDPLKEFKSWLLYANGYYMFGKKDRSAIHLFPEFEVRDALEDVWNLGFGYVLSFKDKKDSKSTINLEVFVKFLDIENVERRDSKFYNRNTIGVSVGLPFNYIF